MINSQKGKEKLGCDGMCYGFPKGHPDRQEMCPNAETCSYNPKIHEEFFAEIAIVGVPILIIIWLIFVN